MLFLWQLLPSFASQLIHFLGYGCAMESTGWLFHSVDCCSVTCDGKKHIHLLVLLVLHCWSDKAYEKITTLGGGLFFLEEQLCNFVVHLLQPYSLSRTFQLEWLAVKRYIDSSTSFPDSLFCWTICVCMCPVLLWVCLFHEFKGHWFLFISSCVLLARMQGMLSPFPWNCFLFQAGCELCDQILFACCNSLGPSLFKCMHHEEGWVSVVCILCVQTFLFALDGCQTSWIMQLSQVLWCLFCFLDFPGLSLFPWLGLVWIKVHQ